MMDLSEFLNEFQLEAGEKLDIMSAQLLRLERDTGNPQPIREMFLAAHTIKGGAAMLRLTDVEALAHAIEDSLSTFRAGTRTLDAATADLLFQAIDRLRTLVAVANAGSVGADPDPAIHHFSMRLRGAPTATLATASTHEGATMLRRALVVDDSPTVRELHRMLLEDLAFEVSICDDGHAALAAAQAQPFTLVVASVLLKTMGGFDLCAALRQRNVPVVLISADADPDMARKAADVGARALVRKGSLYDGRFTDTVRETSALTV